MINTTIDFKNIGLAKTIHKLREDLDVYELISENLTAIQKLGMGKSYFNYALQSAQNSIALQICKIYEPEKEDKKGKIEYELNSIDGIIKNLPDELSNKIVNESIDKFIQKYSKNKLNLRSNLLLTIQDFKRKKKEPLEKFKKYRDKFSAHSEYGAKQKYLPSYDDMEQLFDFANDFYRTISDSFINVSPHNMNAHREVKIALMRILNNHGLKDIKSEHGTPEKKSL